MTTSLFRSDGPRLERIKKMRPKTIGFLCMLALPLTMPARAQAAEPPTVTARPANLISSNSATLIGTINPNGADTGYQFVWGPSIFYGHTNGDGQLPAQDATIGVTNKLTNLTPNTLYHYYLVATNSAGVGISPDMTFATGATNPQAPIVTVDGPSTITSTEATITGTVNPNGLSTGFYVQWGQTTAYGNWGPVLPVGTQTYPVAVTNFMMGLSPNTLYHYQLVATNSAGRGYSADMTLTTLPGGPGTAPTVTIQEAIITNYTGAFLIGTVNPNGADTAYHFLYGTTTAYDHSTSYFLLPAQNADVGVTNVVLGLNPGTLYHCQLVATNSAGASASADLTFTTGPGPNPQPPTVTVEGASQITDTNALITGTVNPNGLQSAFYIRWGTNTVYDRISYIYPVPSLTSAVVVSNWMTGLSPSTLYHFQMVATNLAGNGYSADMTLTTLPPSPPPTPGAPTATTGPTTSITSGSATLNGTVDPNHADTSYYFVWGTTTAYGNPPPSYGLLQAQSGPAGVWASLTGLSPNTTYHYQLLASNSVGSASGGDQAFTTLNLSTNGGFTYTITNSEITITGYTGPGGDVVIPDTIEGLPVTRIADSAFTYQMTLTGITIPDSVIDLGGGAFAFCTNLATVDLGHGITTIKGGLETQGAGTFLACTRLASITIPDNVTTITDGSGSKGGPFGAFADCRSLTNVIIGKGLTYLGNGTFTRCDQLVGVYFQGDAPTFGWSPTPILTTPFFYATNAIVYYVPGTSGWGPTYAGQPTALWGPHPLTRDGSFGMRNNQFGFSISGPASVPLVIEACTDLAAGAWEPLRSCSLTNGLIYFSDPDVTNYPSRFYRVRSP